MSRIVMIACALAIVCSAPAAGEPWASSPKQDGRVRLARGTAKVYDRVARRLGAVTVGRNIARHGVHRRGGDRPATVRELRAFRSALELLLHPPVVAAATVFGDPELVVGGDVLDRIAQCESHGNPRAISRGGTYRGKWQFDSGTWAAYGGRGDPAAAPEPEQRRIATRLYAARGGAPWPVCSRR